jgi:hypothetical protein
MKGTLVEVRIRLESHIISTLLYLKPAIEVEGTKISLRWGVNFTGA